GTPLAGRPLVVVHGAPEPELIHVARDAELAGRAGDEVVVAALAVLAVAIGQETVVRVGGARQLGPPGVVVAGRRRARDRRGVVGAPHGRDTQVVGLVPGVQP